MIVLFLFFCSGATALVYEVAWSRYLSLLLGSSVQAQTVVLAAFMGGLALGNRLFGPVADRTTRPLALYGGLEMIIGIYAVLFDSIYQLADRGFVAFGTGRLESLGGMLLIKSLLGGLLLLGPTILMGGTLPLIAGWLQQRQQDPARWSARFYSINSLGAVAGATLAGFYLLRELGLMSTVQMTGLLNVVVGLVAIRLARGESPAQARPLQKPGAGGAPAGLDVLSGGDRKVFRAACLLVAVTGAVSMGLEVLAARSLVLIVGASLQAFALVLIAFILGIGLGSAVVASPRFSRLPWVPTAAVLLLGAAAWVGVLVIGIEQWVTVYRHLKTGLNPTPMGFRFHQLLTAAMSLVVLGVPAAAIGAVLPVCLRALGGEGGLGSGVGRLLTWNTLGAVAGSLATGFLLMPIVGLRGAFLVMVYLLCTAVVVLSWSSGRRALAAGAVGVGLAIGITALNTGETWRHTLSSGIFRTREKIVEPSVLEERRRLVKLLFYEDAADGTVSVEQSQPPGRPLAQNLRVNGKPDASLGTDVGTQLLLAHIPLLLRPESKEVFILGLGSGATAAAALHHPVERVTVAENCEPVVRASRLFAELNEGVHTNTRARILVDDGRTVLKLSPRPYDVIISEPSNPWMVGVGGVFSTEFYQLCSARLKEDGLMVQWFHIYEMSEELTRVVFRTFNSVFPYMEIWDSNSGDLILVGSQRPWKFDRARLATQFADPELKPRLAALGLHRPEALWARQLASQGTAPAIAGPGPLQTDNFPLLEFEAPKAFFIGTGAESLQRYDERMQQAMLAPRSKRAFLASLTDDEIRAVFGQYGAVFRNVQNHLIQHGRPGSNHTDICIFRTDEWAATPVEIPAGLSAEEIALLENVGRLRSEMRWEEAIGAFITAFETRRSNPQPARWSVAAFARDAATIAISRDRYDLAKAVLDPALAIEPAQEELLFLARVLERRQPKTPPIAK